LEQRIILERCLLYVQNANTLAEATKRTALLLLAYGRPEEDDRPKGGMFLLRD